MNEPPKKNRLLADVLAESEPPDFHASLLGETLRLARRRRHLRHARLVAPLVAALGVLAVFAWRRTPNAGSPSLGTHYAQYELVHTQALPITAIIATKQFGAERLVSSFTSVATLRTPLDRTLVQTVNDRELLALAAPRPAALIRVGPHAQTLIFSDANTDNDSL